MKVRVEDAPGYAHFEGDRVAEVETPDGRLLSVIEWESDHYRENVPDHPGHGYQHTETFIIPSCYVREV